MPTPKHSCAIEKTTPLNCEQKEEKKNCGRLMVIKKLDTKHAFPCR
jgi:hypothetical protein